MPSPMNMLPLQTCPTTPRQPQQWRSQVWNNQVPQSTPEPLLFSGKRKRPWLSLIGSMLFLGGAGMMLYEAKDSDRPIPASTYLWAAGCSVGALNAGRDFFKRDEKDDANKDKP